MYRLCLRFHCIGLGPPWCLSFHNTTQCPCSSDILAPLSMPLLCGYCFNVPRACRHRGFVFMRLTWRRIYRSPFCFGVRAFVPFNFGMPWYPYYFNLQVFALICDFVDTFEDIFDDCLPRLSVRAVDRFCSRLAICVYAACLTLWVIP